jgi:hypothetical protein
LGSHPPQGTLGNLFDSEPTATTAVCEGWMKLKDRSFNLFTGWMVGWMVRRQKHFSIGSTPNTRATNAP